MNNYKKNNHLPQSWLWWRIALTGLSAIALILSAIMSWHYLSGNTMTGCGGGSPCEHVLNSRWSSIAGIIPVSGLAMGVYLAMLIASFFIGKGTDEITKRQAWSALLVLSGAIIGSAIWFIILQQWIIREFCPYCMSAHITGLLLSILIIWQYIVQTNNTSLQANKYINHSKQTIIKIIIGLVLAGILILSQVIFAPIPKNPTGESQNNLPALNYHEVPIIGSPDAPYVVILLFDYQCSHCQKLHFALNEAINQYRGKLAFALCPTPLSTKCNPYIPRDVDAFTNSCDLARIGMTVWIAKKEVFAEFENWMFSFESGNAWHPRSLQETKRKAIELIGEEKFNEASTDPWIDEYINTCTQIYGKTIQNSKGGVPKLIYNSQWVIPQMHNADVLVDLLQNSFGIPKPL